MGWSWIAALPGPAGALLYEAGLMGPSAWGLGMVLGLSLLGIITAIAAIKRDRPTPGIVGLIFNVAVAVLYGFPLVFTALGGSR